ncbi:hypothetical protein ACNO5E_26555, partial [Vibrio parahaemolyticus]
MFLVVTLFSGENEFDKCVKSVSKQRLLGKHYVVKNKPNKVAHEIIYKKMSDNSEYDFMAKIDADMVIENENL